VRVYWKRFEAVFLYSHSKGSQMFHRETANGTMWNNQTQNVRSKMDNAV